MPQKNRAYLSDPAWISWKALVEAETFAVREQFTLEDTITLDDLLLDHQRKRALVTEYKGTDNKAEAGLSKQLPDRH